MFWVSEYLGILRQVKYCKNQSLEHPSMLELIYENCIALGAFFFFFPIPGSKNASK